MAALPAHWAPKTTGLPKTTDRSSFPSVGRMKLRDNDEDASSFSETTGRERRRRSGDGGGNFAQQQQQQRMWWWLPRQKGRFLFYSNGVILLVVLLLSLSLFGVRAGGTLTQGEVDELRTLLNEQGIDDDPRKLNPRPAQAEYWRELYFYPKKTMDGIEKAQKGMEYASLPSMAAGGGMLAAGGLMSGRKHASKARWTGFIIMLLGGLAGLTSLVLKDVAREERVTFNEKRKYMQRMVAQTLGWW